jgi:hypothetical protein
MGLGEILFEAALGAIDRNNRPSAADMTRDQYDAYNTYASQFGTKRREEELADLEHQQSPEMQEIAKRQAYQNYLRANEDAPRYGQIARDENQRNVLSGAATQVDAMRGPGGALIDEAFSKSQEVDPEFYAQRAQTQQGLSSLLRSMYDKNTLSPYLLDANGQPQLDANGQPIPNPNSTYDEQRPQGYFTGNLSAGEHEEINRSLNRQSSQGGNLNVPSMGNVVANAMTYGNAMQNRRNAFGQALGQATSFLPASRSGFDPMQVALGRPSTVAPATFSQPNMQANTSASNNLMASTGQAAMQSANNKPGILDSWTQAQDIRKGW